MKISMVDLKVQYEDLKSEIDPALLQALAESCFILGPNLQAFEQEAADYLEVEHALGCASGTDALHLALLTAGIKPGDEIITTRKRFWLNSSICFSLIRRITACNSSSLLL